LRQTRGPSRVDQAACNWRCFQSCWFEVLFAFCQLASSAARSSILPCR
jgi:hypothetical protein